MESDEILNLFKQDIQLDEYRYQRISEIISDSIAYD